MGIELKQSTLDYLKKAEDDMAQLLENLSGLGRYLFDFPHSDIKTLAKADLTDDLRRVDIAMVGVPTDIGLSHRPGARMGPNALRNSSNINYVNTSTGVRPFDLAQIRDVGNVRFDDIYSLDGVASDIHTHFLRYPEAGVVPVTVGGDHSITYPILKAVAPTEPVGVIHFDAHYDMVPPSHGSKFHHGAPFLLAVLEGHIDPARMVQIGIRDPFTDCNNFARECGTTVIDMDTFHRMGIDNVIAKTRDVVGNGPVYLTIDVDGMDPIFMPGTGTPVAGGLTMREVLTALRGFRGLDFMGADLVEVSPPLENGDLTATNAAFVLFEMLCLVAEAHANR